jgi:threonine dehydrogenase-like Zn-dependent dehydrogenase
MLQTVFNLFDPFPRDITIEGSFAQLNWFCHASSYLESGKIKVDQIVTDEFKLKDWDTTLERGWLRQEHQGVSSSPFV